MFHPGISDGGSGSGRRALLLGDPGGPSEPPRDKESGKGRGGGGGEIRDLAAGTSASSGPSKECVPETGNQSPAGETDYCRRILVRGKGPESWPSPCLPSLQRFNSRGRRAF